MEPIQYVIRCPHATGCFSSASDLSSDDLVTGEEMWAYSNGQYNALTTMKNELNKTKKYNLLSNIYLAITPIKGLTLKTTFSPDINLEEIGQ